MKKLTISLIAVVTLAISGWAAAQDWSLDPTYGTYDLVTGFTPDPQALELTAGGSIDASTLGEGCVGSIADAPDVRVNYTAGSLPLTFGATSEADLTLVINAPDGSWHCNDDFDGFDPVVHFAAPLSGQYDIFVGTYIAELAPAIIVVTELAE